MSRAGVSPDVSRLASAGQHPSPVQAHAVTASSAPADAPGACQTARPGSSRVRYPSAAHGRPQAEAVALAHDQAPLEPQGLGAVGQQLPAVPPAAPPAPGVPALRLLRRARGRRPPRSRPRPRSRPLAPAAMTEPVTVAVDANGADLGPAEVARGAAQAAARGHAGDPVRPARPRWTPPTASRSSTRRSRSPRRPTRRAPSARRPRPRSSRPSRPSPTAAPTRSSPAARPAPRSPPALFTFKRARGVHRPALAILVPVPGAPFLLLDAGANVDVRPEHLVQFAHMGAAFMEVVMGVERPRVALLSNGEEPSKGPEDVVAAHAALTANPGGIDFVGNVEGFAIGKGVADVLVADGFTGNVALKTMEGDVRRAAAGRPRRRRLDHAREARRPAAAARAARAARRDRPRGPRRRRAARPAPARRRAARLLRRARIRERDRGRRPRRARRRARAHARARWRRRARCGAPPESSAAAATVPDQP